MKRAPSDGALSDPERHRRVIFHGKKGAIIGTLWQTYKKLLKMAIEIVDFPIHSMVEFSIAM